MKIGTDQKYTMQNASQSVRTVTCKVYAKSSKGGLVTGNNSVTVQSNGEPLILPRILQQL